MQLTLVTETILGDLRRALRVLYKERSISLITILTLAIAIGANSAIFTVVYTVLIRPLPFAHPEQLVMMSEKDNDASNRMVSYPNFVEWRERNQVFDSMSTVRDFEMSLSEGGRSAAVTAKVVAADYLNVLGLRPILGRDFSREDEKARSRVAIISEAFWHDRFARDPRVLGQSIILNRISFTIVGVVRRPSNSSLIAPISLLIGGDWGEFNWGRDHRSERTAGYVIARMKATANIEQAREQMNAISLDLFRTHPVENAGGSQVNVVSLKDSSTGNARPVLLLLFASVGILLLIAGANVASLLLARSISRRKEIAIRSALGATRTAIVRQGLVESLVLALSGGTLGLFLGYLLISLYSLAGYRIVAGTDTLSIDQPVIIFTLAVSTISGFGFGFVSAWYGSKASLDLLAKEAARSTTTSSGSAVRNLIVIGEIAMAMVLLIATGLMIRSVIRLTNSPLGFNPHQVTALDVNMPYGKYDKRGDRALFYRQLIDRVAALPGVQSVSVASSTPGFADRLQNDIFPEGHPPLRRGELLMIDWDPVTEDYFATMKIPILRGRSFTRQEVDEGRPVVVIDENLAKRFWPGQDAIGKWIKYDSPEKHEVIGIVRDVKQFGSKLEPLIKVYTPLGRATILQSELLIRTSTTDDRTVIPAVATAVQSLDADVPVDRFGTMDDLLAEVATPVKLESTLLSCFTLLAAGLAVFGLYGVTSYTVSERTREIGIRIAIGASGRQVIALILTRGLKLTIVGMTLGLAFSFPATRLIKGVLYGVSTTDPVTLVATLLLFSFVIMLGCLIPAFRAIRVDPARILQCD